MLKERLVILTLLFIFSLPNVTKAVNKSYLIFSNLQTQVSKDEREKEGQRANKLVEEGLQLFNQAKVESYQAALKKFEEAQQIYQKYNSPKGEVNALNQIGTIYNRLGDLNNGLKYFKLALAVNQKLDDKMTQADILNNLGSTYTRLGDRQNGVDFYNQALALSREVGWRELEGAVLSNLGGIYNQMGDNQKALDYFNQALPMRREVKDRSGEAATLNNLGGVYGRLGENQRALQLYLQALPIRREVKDTIGEAATLSNLGTTSYKLGDKEKALDYFNQLLSLVKITGNKAAEAYAVNHIGLIYFDRADNEKALDYYKQALDILTALGGRDGLIASHNSIGRVYYRLKDYPKALESFNQSALISREASNRYSLSNALYSIALVEYAQNDLTKAKEHIEEAIKEVEYIRTNVESQDLRVSYLSIVQEYYELAINILIRLHKMDPKEEYISAALFMSEKARARSLADLLAQAKVNIRQGVDPTLLEQEKILIEKLNNKELERTRLFSRKATKEQADKIIKEIDELVSKYNEIQGEIRQKSPQYANLGRLELPPLKEIQEKNIDQNTIILEYFLGEQQSYLWVVTSNSLKYYQLPKKSEIETLAKQLYEVLIAPGKKIKFETPTERKIRLAKADEQYQKLARELSNLLLAPLAEQIANKKLLIMAQGALQYVPFSALPLPSTNQNKSKSLKTNKFLPLITSCEVTNLSSIATLLALQQRETKTFDKTLTVLADPVFEPNDERVKESLSKIKSDKAIESNKLVNENTNQILLLRSAQETNLTGDDNVFVRLPGTRAEANAIGSLINDENKKLLVLDFEASRSTLFTTQLQDYQHIHFATHGLLNERHPELSGIVLSLVDNKGQFQDGFLRLNEIFNLTISADTVVLSGCQTGLGKDIKGEGLVGLTRGFMYAGASSVVVSLWNVNDKVTADLMTRFYKSLLTSPKKTPVASLRNAQLSLWKENFSPYFWASFIVQGQ